LNNPEYIKWKNFLRESSSWSTTRMNLYVEGELRRVLNDCLKIPAYKVHEDLIRTILLSKDIRKDFKHLPFTHKMQIAENETSFIKVSERSFELERATTGGSTGIPIGLYRSKIAFAKELASKAFQYERLGWKEDDVQLVIRGLPIKNEIGVEFCPDFNELRISSYNLTANQIKFQVDAVMRYNPKWIKAYPSAAYLWAKTFLDSDLFPPTFEGAFFASENLYTFQEEFFKQHLTDKIFSHYGHYEISCLAGYCLDSSLYHVLPQYGYVELISEDGLIVQEPGKSGEIVATSFISDGSILLRYKTGDVAEYAGNLCQKCGMETLIFNKIEGRLHEYATTSDGRRISIAALNMHDSTFDSVKQFQFEQVEPGKLILRVVMRNGSSFENAKREIKKGLENKITGMELTIFPCEDIPISPRGKHLFMKPKTKS
jgi:phenylacetate-CoA ligase